MLTSEVLEKYGFKKNVNNRWRKGNISVSLLAAIDGKPIYEIKGKITSTELFDLANIFKGEEVK